MVISQAEAIARLPRVRSASSEGDRVRQLYLTILRREPTAEELNAAVAAYRDLLQLAADSAEDPVTRATTALAQVLLCSNEFVFVD